MEKINNDKVKNIVDILKFEENNYINCLPTPLLYEYLENMDYYNYIVLKKTTEYEKIITAVLSNCTMDELEEIIDIISDECSHNYLKIIYKCYLYYCEIYNSFVDGIKNGEKEEYIKKLPSDELKKLRVLLGFQENVTYVFDDKLQIMKEVNRTNYELSLSEIFLKNLLDDYGDDFEISHMIYRMLIKQCDFYLNQFVLLSTNDMDYELELLYKEIKYNNRFIAYVLSKKDELDDISSLDKLYEYFLKTDNFSLKIIIKSVMEQIGERVLSFNSDKDQHISLNEKAFLLNLHDPYYDNDDLKYKLNYDSLIKLSNDVYNDKIKIAKENGFDTYQDYVHSFVNEQEGSIDEITKYKMFRLFNNKYNY